MTIQFKPGEFNNYLPKVLATVSGLNQEKEYDLTIEEHREKRSLSANGYCWLLCEKLAQATSAPGAPLTKEDVYIDHIKDVGIYRDFHLPSGEVPSFRIAWENLGTGWPVEIVDYEKDGDTVTARAYYGSSCYDKKRMARLIDAVVQDCKAVGVETLPPEKLAAMVDAHEPVNLKR